MKKLLLLTFVLTPILSNAQNLTDFKLTKDGVKPVLISLENMSSSVIFKKTFEWSQQKYPTFQQTVESYVQDKTIFITGYKQNALYYMGFGFKNEFDVEYSLQIDIEDNRIKLTFTPGQFWTGKEESGLNHKLIVNTDGSANWEFKEAKPSLEKTMNEIGTSLVRYIKNK